MSQPYTMYFDGLVEPVNPGGVAAWGWLLLDGRGQLLASGKDARPRSPENTNNRAEYIACGSGLRYVADRLAADPEFRAEFPGLIVRGDSQLVVEHLNGTWRVKSDTLKPFYRRCVELLTLIRQAGPVELEWVRREDNEAADQLSREAYRDLTGKMPPERRKQKAVRA